MSSSTNGSKQLQPLMDRLPQNDDSINVAYHEQEDEKPQEIVDVFEDIGISFIVPMNQRPSRGNSEKKIGKKTALNQTVQNNSLKTINPLPQGLTNYQTAKPPKHSKPKKDIQEDHEIVDQLTQTINILEGKILKDGIQKDQNFYSNLSELTPQELKSYLINQIYDIKETKNKFHEYSQKIKELMRDFQTGREFSHMREQLNQLLEHKYSQMNFELMYIETKRDLEKQTYEMSHLKHKIEQLKQQAYGNANQSKEYKLKLQKQIDLNSKQHKNIITQGKINLEKTLKVESLLHSVFTLTQEQEIVKNSKFKEEIVLKRTINYLLRENFGYKKQCRIKDTYLEQAQVEINRLKQKVNRLMLRIEDDQNVNKMMQNAIPFPLLANTLNTRKHNITPSRSKQVTPIQGTIKNQKGSMKSINLDDPSLQDNKLSFPALQPSITPTNIILQQSLQQLNLSKLNKQQTMEQMHLNIKPQQTNKSNKQSLGSMFDFEVLSHGHIYHGIEDSANKKPSDFESPVVLKGLKDLENMNQNDQVIKVLSRHIIDVYDIDYRNKLVMNQNEQELNEELFLGDRQRFVEVTMGSQPMDHKERVEFLAKHCVSFKKLSEKLNCISKVITLNELYTYTENNKEVRMSSVDDIVGYVLNNQQDLITANLQKYIQFYQSVSQFSVEEMFFDSVERKSAILLPVKDFDTGMPLGVLEVVNSNTGIFDLDSQYMVYMVADFAGFVINSLNNEIRRRKAEHARTLLNQYAVKIFSQNSLSDLNRISCEAIRQMLHTEKVKFCFIQESLIDLNDYEIIAFSEVSDSHIIDDDNELFSGNRDSQYAKFRTKQYFGIMGQVMETKMPTVIWNPKGDFRYNERIDMKTDNPMYCFPLMDFDKNTPERKVVGCVQFESMQLRLLKANQSIQTHNSAQSSLIIDEHLKSLMKEFGSYIAEVLKIIRNQKLLQKFKSYILKDQDIQEESEDQNLNNLRESVQENLQVIKEEQLSARSNLGRLVNIQPLSTKNQQRQDSFHNNDGFTESYKQIIVNQDDSMAMSRREHKRTGADTAKHGNNNGFHLNISNLNNNESNTLNMLVPKKQVGFALLKQMTRVHQLKSQEQDGNIHGMMSNRKGHQRNNSPDKIKIITDPSSFKTRQIQINGDNTSIINRDSNFESESFLDTEEAISPAKYNNKNDYKKFQNTDSEKDIQRPKSELKIYESIQQL